MGIPLPLLLAVGAGLVGWDLRTFLCDDFLSPRVGVAHLLADALLVALGLAWGGPVAGALYLAFWAAVGLALLWTWEDG